MTKQLLFGQQHASLVYGVYVATFYFTPIVGGVISDRWLGRKRAVIIGAAIMSVGHFLMASESLLYLRPRGDRAGQRPVPAEPAEPDRRPVREGRSASRLGVQLLLRGHQRRRPARAARVRHARRALRLALGLRRGGHRHVAGPCDLHARCALVAAGAAEAARRGARGAHAARGDAQAHPRAARDRPVRHGVPRRVRTVGQHDRVVGRCRPGSRGRRLHDSDDVVPGAQSAAGDLPHATARHAVDEAGERRPRTVAGEEDGDGRVRGRVRVRDARAASMRARAGMRTGAGSRGSSSCSPSASCSSCRSAWACSRGSHRQGTPRPRSPPGTSRRSAETCWPARSAPCGARWGMRRSSA